MSGELVCEKKQNGIQFSREINKVGEGDQREKNRYNR